METFDNLSEKLWQIIHVICELWTFLSIMATVIWFLLPPYMKENLRVFLRRIFVKSKLNINQTSLMKGLLLDDISIIDGPYRDCAFQLEVKKDEVHVPEDFKLVAERLRKENDERKRKGEMPVYSDLIPYAVHSLTIDREPDANKERPVWRLQLRESSYFYSLVSIMSMNELVGDITIREKYYRKLIENPKIPSPDGYDIVHGLGINTLLYTNDKKFVFGERDASTVATGKGCLHLSVGEHLNRMLIDFDEESGEPDITKTLKRGMNEELGIKREKLKDAEIRFYCLAFASRHCQYGVLGITILENYSSKDVMDDWTFSKDGRYENTRLVFIDANIKSVVDYLNNNTQSTMTKFALLNVCVALMTEQIFNVGQKEIDRELKKLRPNAIV